MANLQFIDVSGSNSISDMENIGNELYKIFAKYFI